MSDLPQAELDRIVQTPVSNQRRDAFIASFRADREKTATTEMLFKKVNAFKVEEVRPNPEDVTWSGFNLMIQKAPFTSLPNWGPYRSSEFAVAMEKHLLTRLDEAVRASVEDRLGDPVVRDAPLVLAAFDSMTNELEYDGYFPTLLILAGPLGTQLIVDMEASIDAYWKPAVKQALGTTFRILGTYHGIPILDIPESPSPGAYVVDLTRFATLTRYGKEPEFKLEEIGADRAIELLTRNPNLVTDPPPGPDNDAARIRQLQIKVALQLYETYQLTVADRDAVVGAPLVGPVLEWSADYTRQ